MPPQGLQALRPAFGTTAHCPSPGLLAGPWPSLTLPLLQQACWALRMMATSSPWSSMMETREGSPSHTSASCLPTIRSSVSGGPASQSADPLALICPALTPALGPVCRLDHLHPQGMEMTETIGRGSHRPGKWGPRVSQLLCPETHEGSHRSGGPGHGRLSSNC